AFDKTGTITSGIFSVTDIVPLNGASAETLLQVSAAVEQHSNHPLAESVVRAAQEKQLQLPAANGLENIPGKGVRSSVNGQPVHIGSPKLFDQASGIALSQTILSQVSDLESKGRTVMIVAHGQELLGIIGLADTPRPKIAQVMRSLRSLGIAHLVMLTGDNQKVAADIAAQVGLTDVQAELLPEDKLTTIQQLKQQYQAIAMVGDGVNDAPALASATVGIAMGGAGTAVALETADVALMADDLEKLPFAVGLSRASRSVIQQNLIISMGVIMLLILSSVLGWVALGVVVLLHEGSTLVVVGNALRLLRYAGGMKPATEG
ncbi:MAG: HAD-IC family P-type ATPase, partial [Anaerolineae bacterium]|nr:HAD-IC family P-type ATPase [Anaerolineae bacterium]